MLIKPPEQGYNAKEYVNLTEMIMQDVQNTTDKTDDYFQSEDTFGVLKWHCVTERLNTSQHEKLQNVQFWNDGVCQCTVGIIGIILNLVTIGILLRSRMIDSIYNNQIITLIMHTIYIAFVLISESMQTSRYGDTENITESVFMLRLICLISPVKNCLRYSSTFLITLMARQHYLSICHPVEFWNATRIRNNKKYVLKNLVLVLISAAVFAFPLYFEASIVNTGIVKTQKLNESHVEYVSSKKIDKFCKE